MQKNVRDGVLRDVIHCSFWSGKIVNRPIKYCKCWQSSDRRTDTCALSLSFNKHIFLNKIPSHSKFTYFKRSYELFCDNFFFFNFPLPPHTLSSHTRLPLPNPPHTLYRAALSYQHIFKQNSLSPKIHLFQKEPWVYKVFFPTHSLIKPPLPTLSTFAPRITYTHSLHTLHHPTQLTKPQTHTTTLPTIIKTNKRDPNHSLPNTHLPLCPARHIPLDNLWSLRLLKERWMYLYWRMSWTD